MILSALNIITEKFGKAVDMENCQNNRKNQWVCSDDQWQEKVIVAAFRANHNRRKHYAILIGDYSENIKTSKFSIFCDNNIETFKNKKGITNNTKHNKNIEINELFERCLFDNVKEIVMNGWGNFFSSEFGRFWNNKWYKNSFVKITRFNSKIGVDIAYNNVLTTNFEYPIVDIVSILEEIDYNNNRFIFNI